MQWDDLLVGIFCGCILTDRWLQLSTTICSLLEHQIVHVYSDTDDSY